MDKPVLGYIPRDSVMHRMNPVAKLALVIGIVLATMIGVDTRLLIFLALLGISLFVAARLRLSDFKVILPLALLFMVLNNVFIFLLAPTYGSELYHSTDYLTANLGHWNLTKQQLFYQFNVTLRYFALLPPMLMFVASTLPSNFASALNRIGVPYRFAYAVSLTLRYIPDIQREYQTISLAQQARGLDTSKNVSFFARIKNAGRVLLPLLLSSFNRVETVSAAMDMRGFGRGKKRTWITAQPLKTKDIFVIIFAFMLVASAIALLFINGSRFYNPF